MMKMLSLKWGFEKHIQETKHKRTQKPNDREKTLVSLR